VSFKIPFIKMHGLGNDFVIVEESHLPCIDDRKGFVQQIAHRRLGIGCDQFITYEKHPGFVVMNVYNQDGSRGKTCGNASRCLARLLFEQDNQKDIILRVVDRQVLCHYKSPKEISVHMGPVSFHEAWMPDPKKLQELAKNYGINPSEILCVDVGNPHLIVFSNMAPKDKALLGESCQNSLLFPDGVNVNFAAIDDQDQIHLSVWERGSGFTYACGSGAIATFAAAHKFGLLANEAQVVFKCGFLKIHRADDGFYMTGPASHVFQGEFIYEDL
jgi:diaminopimelate epimerase